MVAGSPTGRDKMPRASMLVNTWALRSPFEAVQGGGAGLSGGVGHVRPVHQEKIGSEVNDSKVQRKFPETLAPSAHRNGNRKLESLNTQKSPMSDAHPRKTATSSFLPRAQASAVSLVTSATRDWCTSSQR